MSNGKSAGPLDGVASENLNGQAAARPPAHGSAEHAIPADLPRISGLAMTVILVVLAIFFAGLFFAGWLPHTRRLAAADAVAADTGSAKPIVETIAPRVSPENEKILLPGDVRANQETAIFARTNGYMKPLPPGIDIGAHVEAGQLIAEIASPEVDAQLDQARASLAQSKITVTRMQQEFELTSSTLKRYETASSGRGVSQQELDEKRSQESIGESALKEAQANVLVTEASVKRLSDLQSFEKVIAPFAGVITARGFDAGSLISSGDTGGGRELFRIQEVDVLRVRVSVPQGYATDVQLGQAAALLVRNFPGREFPGTVARTSSAIDPGTRTLRVEVDVPNKDGTLLPGMYGQIRFTTHRDHPLLILPTSALVFGSDGIKVAVLEGGGGGGGRVRFRSVTLGRDFGVEVEVVTGLTSQDVVVNNPGSLVDGAEVALRKQ